MIKFGMWVDRQYIITYATLGEDRLRVLGMARGRISRFPIDLRRRPYNSLALPCECVITRRWRISPTPTINRSLTFEVSASDGIMTDMCEGKYVQQINKFTQSLDVDLRARSDIHMERRDGQNHCVIVRTERVAACLLRQTLSSIRIACPGCFRLKQFVLSLFKRCKTQHMWYHYSEKITNCVLPFTKNWLYYLNSSLVLIVDNAAFN